MRSLYWVGFLCVFSLACRPSTPDSPAATSLPIADIDPALVQQAFERMVRDTFRLTRTLAVLDDQGRLLGQDVRTGVYHPDSGLRWLYINQHGRFPSGSFNHAVSPAARTPLTAASLLWPDPLPFFQPRQRDAYRFQPLPDTTRWHRRIARLRVYAAAPTHATPQAFQGVLYLDGNRLIGAELLSSHTTLLGTERRYLSIWIDPSDRRLLQEQLILEVDPIGRPPYRFCLETQYRYGEQIARDEGPLTVHSCPFPVLDVHPTDRP